MNVPRNSNAKIVLNQKKEDSVVAQPRAASVSVTLAITQKDAECVTKHFAIPIIFSHATTTSAWIEFVAKNVTPQRFVSVNPMVEDGMSSYHLMTGVATRTTQFIPRIPIHSYFHKNQKVTARDVQELLGGCQDDVLALDGFSFPSWLLSPGASTQD